MQFRYCLAISLLFSYLCQVHSVAVTLKAKSNNKYICADSSSNSVLVANRVNAAEWETFVLIRNSDSTVSFRSMSNYMLVCAEGAGNLSLVANRKEIGPWEKFTMTSNKDGTISLKSVANSLYVSIDNDKAELIANKYDVGPLSSFVISNAINYLPVTFQSLLTKLYVSAGNSVLIANGINVGPLETFLLTQMDNGLVSFRSLANNQLVCVENSTKTLIASQNGIREHFNIIYNYNNDNILLIAQSTNKLVAVNNKQTLLANEETTITSASLFYINYL